MGSGGGLLPAVRQQFLDTAVRMAGKALQHIPADKSTDSALGAWQFISPAAHWPASLLPANNHARRPIVHDLNR